MLPPVPIGARGRPLVIAGIDPGSLCTGYGLLSRDRGGRLRVLSYGVIRTRSRDPLSDRLLHIFRELEVLFARHQPAVASVEQVFMHKHARAALVLGHARAAALLAASVAGLKVYEYAPREMKKNVTGTGGATKAQVAAMVVRLLGLDEQPPEDAADALAMGLCHALRRDLPVVGSGAAGPEGRGR